MSSIDRIRLNKLHSPTFVAPPSIGSLGAAHDASHLIDHIVHRWIIRSKPFSYGMLLTLLHPPNLSFPLHRRRKRKREEKKRELHDQCMDTPPFSLINQKHSTLLLFLSSPAPQFTPIHSPNPFPWRSHAPSLFRDGPEASPSVACTSTP
jgi:hypothetical protein